MRRANEKIITIILTMITTFVIGIGMAQADYQITKYQQHITINEDGSALIEKEVHYHFDKQMNGIYLNETLKGLLTRNATTLGAD
ncbi:DUF2207 domain-containing protein [Leuconostoc citreum]